MNKIPVKNLKPCPFCGVIPKNIESGSHLSPLNAEKSWNSRPNDKEITIDFPDMREVVFEYVIGRRDNLSKEPGYCIISYYWERDGWKQFEMDIHDGGASDFLNSVKDDNEEYTIISTHEITKNEYDKILGAMT